MQFALRLAFGLAIAVALFSPVVSAAFLYTELTSTDSQQCAQASVVFVHMYECGFCFSTGAASSYQWLCNMTYAEKFQWSSSSSCSGQPDSSTPTPLYLCEGGAQVFVYEGTTDAIMNGILNLAFAPGKIFTVASYFHNESTICASGQNAPELVATSASFCPITATVTLCNSTHVEELACASGCGPGSCSVISSTPLPCATSTSGTVKLECRIDVFAPPQGVQPPLGGGGNPFPDFPPGSAPPPGFNPPPFDGTFPPGFNPPPFDGTFPPGFNPPPFDGTFPPGFNPPPFDGTFPPGFNPPPFDGTFPPGFNPPPFDGNFPPGFNAPPSGGNSNPPAVQPSAAQTPFVSVGFTIRLSFSIVADVSVLPLGDFCSRMFDSIASVLAGIDSRSTSCTAVASNKRAGATVAVAITFSDSSATIASTALLGADKNTTITALTNRLARIQGVESVSNVQAESVNTPTASSAPVKPAAPTNAKASSASSVTVSSIALLSLISLALAFTG